MNEKSEYMKLVEERELAKQKFLELDKKLKDIDRACEMRHGPGGNYKGSLNPPKMVSAISLIVVMILFAVLCCVFSCKKEEKVYDVTISCDCQSSKFLFTYSDKDGWHNDTITVNTFQKHIQVTEAQLPDAQQMKSLLTMPSDSMSIKGEFDGRAAQSAFRSTAGPFRVSIQLSTAQ